LKTLENRENNYTHAFWKVELQFSAGGNALTAIIVMFRTWIGSTRFGVLRNGQRELAQHLRCVGRSASFKITRSAMCCPAAPPPVNTISKMSLRMMATAFRGFSNESSQMQLIIAAVKSYKVVNNMPNESSVYIPRTFVVPNDCPKWPPSLWGLKLGAKIKGILRKDFHREHRKKFKQIGLTPRNEWAAQQVIEAFKTYRKVHNIADGDTVYIPRSFVVPRDDSDWPRQLWGLKLGVKAQGILHSGHFIKYRAEFDRLGLTEKLGPVDDRAQQLMLAIKTYKLVYRISEGSPVAIPLSFVVPHDSPDWPQELWGLKLGEKVDNILQGHYAEYQDEFDALGLTAKFGPVDDRAQRIIQAVKTYKRVHGIPDGGKVVIPVSFVVPHDSIEWPQELWGLKLGMKTSDIHHGRYAEYRDEFDALGLTAKLGPTDLRAQRIIQAVKTYKHVHGIPDGGKVVIPGSFVVPHDSSVWPRELWGMKLGDIARNILGRECFREYWGEFQMLGLSRKLGSLEERARQFLWAVETYRKVRRIPPDRQVFVPYYYIVPHGSPDWPQELWGVKLGEKIKNYHHGNTFPDYTEQFRALGLYRKWE
jgi:hypothetical protein